MVSGTHTILISLGIQKWEWYGNSMPRVRGSMSLGVPESPTDWMDLVGLLVEFFCWNWMDNTATLRFFRMCIIFWMVGWTVFEMSAFCGRCFWVAINLPNFYFERDDDGDIQSSVTNSLVKVPSPFRIAAASRTGSTTLIHPIPFELTPWDR